MSTYSILESTGYIGLKKGTHATSKDLYVAYCRWCNDNLDVPVSERYEDSSISYSNKNKAIISQLYDRGIFQIKDSVPKIADELGISKNTVYLHLRKLQPQEN